MGYLKCNRLEHIELSSLVPLLYLLEPAGDLLSDRLAYSEVYFAILLDQNLNRYENAPQIFDSVSAVPQKTLVGVLEGCQVAFDLGDCDSELGNLLLIARNLDSQTLVLLGEFSD